MSSTKVYLNGQVIPAGEAAISIFDPGFLHGASTFSTLLARNGVVFRFDRHLRRMAETVQLLGLDVALTGEQLREATYQVLRANDLTDARIRITLTPGPPNGVPTTLITAESLPVYPAEWYEKGIGVIVTALKQVGGDPTFGYKTGCYLPRLLARQEAAAKGCEDALWYTTDNHLAEACFSNVFLVHAGTVYTPPRDTPVLPGVVRDAVLEVCEQLDIPAECNMPLTVQEMLSAEEMFLTSSTMGIRPVVRVERHAVGDEKPGPITRKIREAYESLVQAETERPDLQEDDHART